MEHKTKKKNSKTILDLPNYILISGIVIIGIGMAWSSVSLFIWLDKFGEKGQIGDTIGGLTTPVFNLIASILVFISFREQYKANQLQKQALDNEIKRSNAIAEYNQIVDLIEEIKAEVKSLVFYISNSVMEDEKHKGIIALKNIKLSVLSIEKQKINTRFWNNLNVCLNMITFTISRIESYQHKIEDEQILRIILYNFLKKASKELNDFSEELDKVPASHQFMPFFSFMEFEKRINKFVTTTEKEILDREL